MSLRPVRRSRRRSNPHPLLQTTGNWNFNWKKPTDKILGLFGKKVFALLVCALAVSGAFAVMYADPNNPLFHNQTGGKTSTTGPDPDIVTSIYSATGSDSTLHEFNLNCVCLVSLGSNNLWTGSREINLTPNSTTTAIALTKTSFDPSIASGKHLKFIFYFGLASGSFGVGRGFQLYFTRNATVPGSIDSRGYNPKNDPSVAFIMQFDNFQADGGGFDYEGIIFAQRNPGEAISTETGACGGAGACYMSQTILYSNGVYAPSTNPTQFAVWLNYTGNSGSAGSPGTSGSCAATGTFPQGGRACTVEILTPSNTVRADTGAGTTQFPTLDFQGEKYYIGIINNIGNANALLIGLNTGTIPNQIDPTSNAGLSGSASFQVGSAQLISLSVTVSPTIDTGGFFGPIIHALINLGVFILNSILGFIAFLAPALQAALNFLEGLLVSALNGLGNALGLGNVGTTLQQLINSVITFFSSGQFSNIMANLPTAISRLIDILTVYFPWLGQAILIGAQVATFLIKGVGFTITILGNATSIGIGVTATILIVLFFVYTGDNSLGGVLEFWQTTLWLIVGLGLKFLVHLVNFILDIVTNIIGIIPKPFIQMVAHAMPRLPIVNTEATFVPPSGLMSEIRNGNLFALALWISGLLFTDLYESASPALPGSIGALLPASANALKALAGLSSLLTIMTVFVWIAAIFIVPIGWFANAMDLGQLPVESSLGNRPATHFGISVSKAEKHGNLKSSLSGFRQAFRKSSNVRRFGSLGISAQNNPENIN